LFLLALGGADFTVARVLRLQHFVYHLIKLLSIERILIALNNAVVSSAMSYCGVSRFSSQQHILTKAPANL
jgi:hypothetical protein